MILFIIILLLIIYFIFSDLVPIIKKKQGKIFWIYTTVLSIALILNVLILVNYKIPIISVALKKLLGVFLELEQ